MIANRNNHVFKGHKTLLGSKYVTYGEVELPLRYEMFPQSKNGFDWGDSGSGSKQLSFSILCQLSNKDFARENVSKFTNEVVKSLNSRDWILSAIDVLEWIKENASEDEVSSSDTNTMQQSSRIKKIKKPKSNVVKEICKELGITQKMLAEILEVPEGTVSSWAVKNEIPRLGKKAIEFYMLNTKNQQIVDSYKSFVHLLQAS